MSVRDLVLQLQIMISVVIFRSNVCCLTVFTSEIYGFLYKNEVHVKNKKKSLQITVNAEIHGRR